MQKHGKDLDLEMLYQALYQKKKEGREEVVEEIKGDIRILQKTYTFMPRYYSTYRPIIFEFMFWPYSFKATLADCKAHFLTYFYYEGNSWYQQGKTISYRIKEVDGGFKVYHKFITREGYEK